MKKRVIGLVVAAGLAVAAVVVIAQYLEDAGDREAAGTEVADVFVVSSLIPAGTPAEQIGEAVRLAQVPAALVIAGAITDLDQIAGLVASTDLLPQEQLTVDRFIEAAVLDSGGGGPIEIAEGHVEFSIDISPAQAVGGAFVPGDRVTIVAVFDAGVVPADTVKIVMTDVLVTRVQGGVPAVVDAEAVAAETVDAAAPTANVLVTVSLDGPSVERLVFVLEYGRLYLAHESADTGSVLSLVATAENVLGA